MGLLGLFRNSGKMVATISFGFRPDFETTYRVSVSEEGTFPDGYENWIWNLFYATALQAIGKSQISEGLKSQLESWAEEHIVVLLSALPVPTKVFLTLDQDLEITHGGLGGDERVYELVIIQGRPSWRNPEAWPAIKTRVPRHGFQNRLASAVLVLTQHLMAKNTYFTRMLPLHILSMRRFYEERLDYSSARSVADAPVFAMEKEIDWNTNAQPRILEKWEKWLRESGS
jgi:hypothetical protein